jgi:hypothetical protein
MKDVTNKKVVMRKAIPGCVLSAVFTALIVSPASAQTLYGSLVGNITDPSGAAVPGASVVVTNPATGFTRQATTDERGAYQLVNLLPGNYEVKISATSFAPVTNPAVAVSPNAVVRVDERLQLAGTSEAVTVSATGTALQTDRADVRTEMAAQQVQDLPVSGQRNYTSLAKLVAGISPPKLQHSIVSNPQENLVTNVNGADDERNNTRVDGASSSHVWLPRLSLYAPPLEAIESVNFVTNSMDAEQGIAGGSVVSVTTRSGTNDFHAVAFEYNQISALKAKNVFSTGVPQTPKYIQNQFGGAVGGPIKKNKLFFFINEEETMRRWNASRWVTIPTADQRAGDFRAFGTTIYDPLTGNANGTGRQPIPSNMIPLNRQSPTARTMNSWLPEPTNSAWTSNYYASGSSRYNRNNSDAKVNWNKSDKLNMFGRFSILNYTVWSPTPFDKASGEAIDTAQQAGTGEGRIISTIIGATYIATPTFLIDASVGYGRFAPGTYPIQYGQNVGLDVLHLPGTNGPGIFYSGIPQFSVSGYESVGNPGSAIPFFWHDNQYQYNLNATRTMHSHNIRFGVDISREHMNHLTTESGSGPRGGFSYSSGTTALSGGATPTNFNAFAAYMLGFPSSLGHTIATEMPASTRAWRQGYYVRDQWQATRNLTLTLGLRYEYYPLISRAHRGIERYDLQKNIMLLGGIGDVPKNIGVSVSHQLFAPRLGFAYRLGAKFVVRAGYGIAIDPYSLARPWRTNYPILLAMSIPAANSFAYVSKTEEGIPSVPVPDASTGRVPIAGNVSAATLPDRFQRGYTHTYNFTIQRELPWNISAQMGYVGSHGNIAMSLNQNWGDLGQGTAGQQLNKLFGRTASTTLLVLPPTSNDYNSLQTSLTRRFKGGLQMQASYTFSKSLSYVGGYGIPPMYSLNRGLSAYDRPHNLQVGFTAVAPFGAGARWAKAGVSGAILGGWQLNGIFSRYCGTPFGVGASGTSLNTSGSSQSADQVKKHVEILGGTGPGQSYFDPFAFASVTGVRFGATGPNILRGPGVSNLDLGLFRELKATEKVRVQFRAEAFNFTNTPHFNNPGTNVSNMTLNSNGTIRALNGYTEITSAQPDERQVRLGLRISF